MGRTCWAGLCRVAVLALFCGMSMRIVSGAEGDSHASVFELKKLTLDQLIELPVISASRVPEPWFTAPYAIDVLTDEDIRRIGAVRLPEALRYSVGLDVARFVGSSYAVTARGFNSTAANKLQVMLDGRSLYTPLLSGTFWEIQDTMMEDLDRIEVVRGPGGSLWGANAVNGVINIITKSARDTQGMLIMAGGGDEERFFSGIRYGGQLAENSYYRVYVKEQLRDDQQLSTGQKAADGLRQTQLGFRSDSYFLGTDQLTVQADGYLNEIGLRGRDDEGNSGGNFLARWSRDLAEHGDVRVQAWYDRGVRDVPLQFFEDRQTIDLDAQHHFKWRERHDVVYGFEYRGSFDVTGRKNRTFRFDPPSRALHLAAGFIQDEITLIDRLLKFTAGTRLEGNTFSGFEAQPNGRITLTPAETHTVWGAVSRAVRTPTRVDEDVRFSSSPSGTPLLIRGNRDFESEEVVAYEGGYRVQVAKKVSVDVAGYYNDYENLRTQEPSAGTVIPFVVSNERKGQIYGGEIALKVQVTPWARVTASYSRMEEELHFTRRSADPTAGSVEGDDPHDFATLRLALDLPHDIEVDIFGRYMDALPNPKVPAYFMFDVRLGWRVNKHLELSVVGQNLNDPQHREFGGAAAPEVERSIFGKATLRF